MKFEIYQDSNFDWHWRLRTRDGDILAVCTKGYSSIEECERAIQLLPGAYTAVIVIVLQSEHAAVELNKSHMADS